MDAGKVAEHISCLIQQGYVDDQFLQLQQLQDESNPEFVAEVVGLYFDDSEKLLEELARALTQDPVDFKLLDAYVHQLKGSSASLGVRRMQSACITFRTCCEASDVEGCWQSMQQLRQEFVMLKGKLEELFEMERLLVAQSGGNYVCD